MGVQESSDSPTASPHLSLASQLCIWEVVEEVKAALQGTFDIGGQKDFLPDTSRTPVAGQKILRLGIAVVDSTVTHPHQLIVAQRPRNPRLITLDVDKYNENEK